MTSRARRNWTMVGAAALVAAATVYGLVTWRQATGRLLDPDDPALVARGAEVYAARCAACHGASLEGQPDWRSRGPDGRLPAPPHDASGHTWHHPDALLVTLTRDGPAALVGGGYESNMPAYAGVLDDREIRGVLSYIKSTWPAEIRRRHDEINRRAGTR